MAFDKSKFLAGNKKAKERKFDEVGPGTYLADLQKFYFREDDDENPAYIMQWKIDDDVEEFGGKLHQVYQSLKPNEEGDIIGYEILNRDLERFGVDIDDADYVANNMDSILTKCCGTRARITIKPNPKNPDYTNTRIVKVIESAYDSEVGTGEELEYEEGDKPISGNAVDIEVDDTPDEIDLTPEQCIGMQAKFSNDDTNGKELTGTVVGALDKAVTGADDDQLMIQVKVAGGKMKSFVVNGSDLEILADAPKQAPAKPKTEAPATKPAPKAKPVEDIDDISDVSDVSEVEEIDEVDDIALDAEPDFEVGMNVTGEYKGTKVTGTIHQIDELAEVIKIKVLDKKTGKPVAYPCPVNTVKILT